VHVFENFDFPDYFGQENKDSNFHNFLHGDVNNLEKLYLSTINNGQHCQTCSHLLNYLQKDKISVVLSSARNENKWPRP